MKSAEDMPCNSLGPEYDFYSLPDSSLSRFRRESSVRARPFGSIAGRTAWATGCRINKAFSGLSELFSRRGLVESSVSAGWTQNGTVNNYCGTEAARQCASSSSFEVFRIRRPGNVCLEAPPEENFRRRKPRTLVRPPRSIAPLFPTRIADLPSILFQNRRGCQAKGNTRIA